MSQQRRAALYINGQEVGQVLLQGTEDSWSHGRFFPNDAFAPFAALFGRWSLLMHADGSQPLSEAASSELRKTEYEIDRLRAKLHVESSGQWVRCAQLNIDGELIEWKRG